MGPVSLLFDKSLMNNKDRRMKTSDIKVRESIKAAPS